MLIPKQFLNKYGDMNPNSWSRQNGSENPTTFNVMFYFLLERARGRSNEDNVRLQGLLSSKYQTNGGKLMTNNYDNDDSFSLDESVAYGAACYKYDYISSITFLKVVTKQTYYRFYDVIPYLVACKFPALRYILLPYISLIILLSTALCKEGDSSGSQLNLIRIIGQDMKLTYTLSGFIMRLKGTSYKDKLATYFPEGDHPINVLARECL